MFSYVKGNIINLEDSKVSVLVEGIGLGLEINISSSLISIYSTGDNIELYLYHHITENGESLFGFKSLKEKELFKSLIKISGVGGKVAIALLGLGIHSLVQAIEENNEKFISQAPGVGKKMAMKIILELKNQVNIGDLLKDDGKMQLSKPHSIEIINSLVGMGYNKIAVEEIVRNIPDEIIELKEKIVYSIKMLGSK